MQRQLNRVQQHLYDVIFGTDTRIGKLFDLALIATILTSVFVVLLDSFQDINAKYGELLLQIEIAFTVLFTFEYFVRLYCSPNRSHYALSFFGIVDLISILPTYIALVFPGIASLMVIRLLRIVRIFRILRLIKYLSEANILLRSLWQSRRKIIVFFFIVQILAIIYGCLMYVVEGPLHEFTNIPQSIYWAIVTITTVGYGDITPHTTLGQVLAAFVMITGYAIIAVPTGIFTAELALEISREKHNRRCKNCSLSGHDGNAQYCKHCGTNLQGTEDP